MIIKGLLLGALFTGLNLTWAEDLPAEANGETNKSIIAMDADGNCFAIDTDNNVVDCPRELVEQVNQTLLVENIPADVAILQQEGKCVVVSKDVNNVVDCTEEESFALQLFTQTVDEAETKEWIKRLGYLGGSVFIAGAGIAIIVGFSMITPALLLMVVPVTVFFVPTALLLLAKSIFTSYHWSEFGNPSEMAEILQRALKSADFSLLREEHIAKLQ